jgi:5-deoxy-glucuronate isomerase
MTTTASDTHRLHLPAGSAASGPYALQVTPESAGWRHSSLRVLELMAGAAHTLLTGEDEVLVVPLAGGCEVECEGRTLTLSGRSGVLAGPTDFAYLPGEATAVLRSPAGGRFALCGARAPRRLPARYGPAADVPVELRGAGRCSRQVNNFATAGVFEADSIIACEVITPGGNWPSYPPHKHDEITEIENELEEVYYFEIAPGRDLYYLNVMAGPGAERAWRIVDDPAHAWIRGTWADQPVDPRLPLHSPASTSPNGASPS